ncbi:MAG: biotin-dependent carboxyltransferase family protein [Pyrinomonadaceae bacterium]
MSILVQKPGVLTTIQDLGRRGSRRFGVNPSGAMDLTAARLVNILVGNNDNCPVLEMHFPPSQLFFEQDALVALGGADFDPDLNGARVQNWKPFFAGSGSSLRFNGKKHGNRCYLAVAGGMHFSKWLGSSSTNLAAKKGGIDGRAVRKGDRLSFENNSVPLFQPSTKQISASLIPRYSRFPSVRVIAGAEMESVSGSGMNAFLKTDFIVSRDSDRMGYRLSGRQIEYFGHYEMVSSAVNFGTVQLLPDGQLIVLMADHQTTGGYPRIAHVISRDLPLLAQLGPNDKVAFHLISLREAEADMVRFERDLNFLRVGCKLSATLS